MAALRFQLNNKNFWNWMENLYIANDDGINSYLRKISDNEIRKDYIVEISDTKIFNAYTSPIEILRKYMPYEYFLEVQYCAAAYATIFGRIFPPISPYVNELAYIEWLLYVEPRHSDYRDHLVHMFKVAYVNDRLLSLELLLRQIVNLQFKSKHFRDWCNNLHISVEQWDSQKRQEIVRIAVFLSSLFHDVGYGYYFLREYKQKLFRLYHWLVPLSDPVDVDSVSSRAFLNSLSAHFIRRNHQWFKSTRKIRDNNASKHTEDFSDRIVSGFFYNCLPLNHSLASAMFLIDLAEKLSKARAISQSLYCSFHLAAEASMIHDMMDVNRWLHLECDSGHFVNYKNHKEIPIAMLLVLSDQLSRWNSPKLDTMPNKNDIKYNLNCSNNLENIEVEIRQDKQKELIIKPKKNKKEFGKYLIKEFPWVKRSSESDDVKFKLLHFSVRIS